MRANGHTAVDDARPEAGGVVRDAWVLAARMQYEMLGEVTEETERLLHEAEEARAVLLRHAAEFQADAVEELERAQAMHAAALRAREEASRQAEALRAEVADEAQRTRDEAERRASDRLASVEREIEAVRDEVSRYRVQIVAEAESEGIRLLAETAEECERARARARDEIERERRAMLDEAAARVERTLAEATATADARRAQAVREAAELMAEAKASVERLRAGVVADGRREVARLAADATAELEGLRSGAEDQAQQVVTQAEGVATLLRSEAAKSFAETLRRAEDEARDLLDRARADRLGLGDGPATRTPGADPEAMPSPVGVEAPDPVGDDGPVIVATEPEATRAELRRRARSGLRVLAFLVPALLLAVLVKTFVVSPVSVSTGSMQPELRDGERVLVSHLSYLLHEPRHGDVVAFRSPLEEPDRAAAPVRFARRALEAVGLQDAPGGTVLARVVAVGGETVEARDGRLIVNDRARDEPYLPAQRETSDFDAERVPDGHVWVMSDDREGPPLDSRSFGAVDVDAVGGRAVLRTWPPLRFGTP